MDRRNQVIESTSKNLKRRLTTHKEKWVEELPWVLQSDKTIPKTFTRQTLYSLVYGTEVVQPIEIMAPTARYGLMTCESN